MNVVHVKYRPQKFEKPLDFVNLETVNIRISFRIS